MPFSSSTKARVADPLSDPVLVIFERHIKLPVTAVVDAPMVAYRGGELFFGRSLADNIVSHGNSVAFALLGAVDRHAGRRKPFPTRSTCEFFGNVTEAVAMFLDAAMVRLLAVMLDHRGSGEIIVEMVQKGGLDSS